MGDDHDKTREASECLKHLTQQAVVLQKKMNEIYTGKSKATLPPIQIQPPSMGSVLDNLNIINGILFVQISQQDIDSVKQEFEKRQKEAEMAKSESEDKTDEKVDDEKLSLADDNVEAAEAALAAADLAQD